MKVPYMKDLASHHGPESCLDAPQGRREALTGESVSMVLSSEIMTFGSRPRFVSGSATVRVPLTGEVRNFRRSLRPIACTEAPRAEIGRPGKLPRRRQTVRGWFQ